MPKERALRGLLLALLLVQPVSGQGPASGSPAAAAKNAEAKRISDAEAERSAALAREALHLARDADDRVNAGEALHNLAVAHRNLGRYDSASDFAHESLAEYTAAGHHQGRSQAYNTLGLIASDRGNYPLALEHHHKALEIRLANNDRQGLAYSYNNLGNMYRNVQDYERALDNHRRSLAIKQELGDRAGMAFSHANMGNVYRSMGDGAKALAAYEAALTIRQALGDQRAIASTLNSIGLVLEKTEPRRALEHYEQALKIRDRIDDKRGYAGTLNNIGNLQRALDDPDRAVDTLKLALTVAQQIQAPVIEIESYQHLANAEAARGNFKAALDWHQKYSALKDKVFNQENSDRLNRLNAAYDARQREQQIAMLRKDAELREAALGRQRAITWSLVGGITVTIMLVALAVAAWRRQQRSEARVREQAFELQAAIDTAKTLSGLLPICASCKKIRDDRGYWQQLESYISTHSKADFTHGFCPHCADDMLREIEHVN